MPYASFEDTDISVHKEDQSFLTRRSKTCDLELAKRFKAWNEHMSTLQTNDVHSPERTCHLRSKLKLIYPGIHIDHKIHEINKSEISN